MTDVSRQLFNPPLTPWHITVGTYGTRLHGGARPTVDKQHNQLNEQFVWRDPEREERERERMKFAPIYLSHEQRLFAEAELVPIAIAAIGVIASVPLGPIMFTCYAMWSQTCTEKKCAAW